MPARLQAAWHHGGHEGVLSQSPHRYDALPREQEPASPTRQLKQGPTAERCGLIQPQTEVIPSGRPPSKARSVEALVPQSAAAPACQPGAAATTTAPAPAEGCCGALRMGRGSEARQRGQPHLGQGECRLGCCLRPRRAARHRHCQRRPQAPHGVRTIVRRESCPHPRGCWVALHQNTLSMPAWWHC